MKKTLILKRTDGTIKRFSPEEAVERFKTLPVTQMTLECMYGGTPLPMPEGGYVIEQEGHEYMVADFLQKND